MDIQEERRRIDEIDPQIVRLFTERMQASAAIGKAKLERDLPVSDPAREVQIIARLSAGVDRDMVEPLSALYREIFRISRDYQEQLMRQEQGHSS